MRVRFDGREHVIEADAVVCALGARSNGGVAELVERLGIPHAVVGDAQRPGKILTAIRRANEVARRN